MMSSRRNRSRGMPRNSADSQAAKHDNHVLEMPCLGVPFQLGMLYDCRSNQVIPGVTLWDDKLLKDALQESPQPTSAFEIIAEDTVLKKSKGLGIEGNLSLSVLSGLVNVEGAAKFFHDSKATSRHARVTLQYKCTSKFQQLTMEQLAVSNIQHPESVFKDNNGDTLAATHVVTAVLYGAEAFFIFDREVTSKENHRIIQGKMHALVTAIPGLVGIGAGTELTLPDTQDKEVEKLQCKFYGDLILDHNPSTYQEAVRVYNELPKYFGEHGSQTVPKKVWLHPLSDLDSRAARMVREISTGLITQTQQLLEALNDIEIKSFELISNVVYDYFPYLKDQVLEFREIIQEHKANFLKHLSKILPQIRGGGTNEQELAGLLEEVHKSPLSIKSLNAWVKGKETELKTLKQYLDVLEKTTGVIVAVESDDFQSDILDCKNTLNFEFAFSSESDDDALQQMLDFLRSGVQDDQVSVAHHWYKSREVLNNIRIKLNLFTSFAKVNSEKKDIKFVARNKDDDNDGKLGAVIMHYENNIPVEEFEPPSKPGKLEATVIEDTSVKLQWKAPEFGLDSIKNFIVFYCSVEQPNMWISCSTNAKEISMTINQLEADKWYVFKVTAETDLGHSEESESTPIQTKPPRVNTRLQHIISNSTVISTDASLVTYKIMPRSLPLNKKHKNIQKMEFGDPPHPPKPTKVLMVVGATGAGKSTLINAIVNFLLGVKWENNFRLKLICDEVSKSQAHSQTQNITAYTFNWYPGSPLNCNITIIDTPGFGDTRGLERDGEITALIRDFFETESGVDELHAIGFVTQASLARLTPTQKYISDSILSIFGRDIKDSIFIMTTFADGADPPVMGAVKEAKIPHSDFFPFNNSALFVDSSKSEFAKMFWDMGYASLKAFLLKLEQAQSVSLQLTRQVLDERHQLETIVLGIQPQIDAGLSKINELHQEEQMLKENESKILRNEDFTYQVTVTKQRKIDAPRGTYVTNCANCHFTCHDNCAYADDRDKWKCCAMNGNESNATCKVCPGQCSWRLHFNNAYHFELYEEVEVRTKKELFDRYNEAKSAKENIETIIQKMEDELRNLQMGVLFKVRQARGCLQRLDEIALKPNPLTEVEYIDLLIRSEEQQKKPGWDKRIEYFQKVRKHAEFLSSIKDPKEYEILAQESSKSMWGRFVSGVKTAAQYITS